MDAGGGRAGVLLTMLHGLAEAGPHKEEGQKRGARTRKHAGMQLTNTHTHDHNDTQKHANPQNKQRRTEEALVGRPVGELVVHARRELAHREAAAVGALRILAVHVDGLRALVVGRLRVQELLDVADVLGDAQVL